jgi:DNA-binding response OmpR family regulator
MTILIAEDDPISRKVLRLTLQQLGYEVLIADDGAEAWELFDKDPVRIIVSDWMMPGLDGLELCRRVRDRPQTPYTYIIMLTAAHTTSDDYSLAMQSGIDDFLTKPLNREMLRTRLHVAERILRYSTEINVLQGLIPICAYCHKVRSGADYWERVDSYIAERTGAHFSHTACPACYAEQMKILDGKELSAAGKEGAETGCGGRI